MTDQDKANALSYKGAGVDIDNADATKQQIASMLDSVETADNRVLNRVGAFASLLDGSFPALKNPVLVFKTEEPGSKQKLAAEHGRYDSICYDLVNHLINDVIVMGATPLFLQDAIICGKLEKEVVTRFVSAMASACREQNCALVGGETSEQPGMIAAGLYVLTASAIGVVDQANVIDGSTIREGDVAIALPSSGLHTNGYSLVRALLSERPELVGAIVEGTEVSFLDAIFEPHRCYWQALRGLFGRPSSETCVHGLAHITGGGIQGNLNRVLPTHLDAAIDRSAIRIPPLFRFLRDQTRSDDADLMRTFNLGVGMVAVVAQEAVEGVQAHFTANGYPGSYPIGRITSGTGKVVFEGGLRW